MHSGKWGFETGSVSKQEWNRFSGNYKNSSIRAYNWLFQKHLTFSSWNSEIHVAKHARTPVSGSQMLVWSLYSNSSVYSFPAPRILLGNVVFSVVLTCWWWFTLQQLRLYSSWSFAVFSHSYMSQFLPDHPTDSDFMFTEPSHQVANEVSAIT